MSQTTAESIISEALIRQFGKEGFERYFQGVEPSENGAVLTVSSPFAQQFILDQKRKEFERALNQAGVNPKEITWRIEECKTEERAQEYLAPQLAPQKPARERVAGNPPNQKYFELKPAVGANNVYALSTLEELFAPNSRIRRALIHGPPGAGKTFLVASVLADFLSQHERAKAYMAGVRALKQEYLSCIGEGTDYERNVFALQRKIGDASALVIDDFHMLKPSPGTQEFLTNLLDKFYGKGTPCILISEFPPNSEHFPKLEERLVSRISDSVVAQVSYPSQEEAIKIAKTQLEFYAANMQINPALAERIVKQSLANNPHIDPRSLSGLAQTFAAQARVSGKTIISIPQQYQEAPARNNPQGASRGCVLQAVAEKYCLKPEEILSETRGMQSAANARAVAAYLLLRTGMSTTEVGKVLGRNHATIVYAGRKVENNPALKADAQELAQHLQIGKRAPAPSQPELQLYT